MILSYTPLPHEAAPRPLADIDIAGVTVKGLVDSGAINTIAHSWIAESAGINLGSAPERTLGVGASPVAVRFHTVELRAAGLVWEAGVGFSDNWAPGWVLLGHNSFFRYFWVTFRAADLQFEILPEGT